MTPPFGTSVALLRCGWGRGGGVFLVTTTLLLSAGCAMKGDVRRLQDEVAGQAARQEAQLRELSADIEALQDSLEVQSAIANEMVVDTRGGIARELRDIRTQLSQLTQLTGQIQRSVVLMSQRLQAEGAGVTTSPRRADPDSLRALLGRGGDPAAADETYEAAVTQFNRGSLNTARMAFSSFLGDYPDHRLAPSAQFYLGDILFQENRLDEAIGNSSGLANCIRRRTRFRWLCTGSASSTCSRKTSKRPGPISSAWSTAILTVAWRTLPGTCWKTSADVRV